MRRLSKPEKELAALHDGRAVSCQVSSRYLAYGETYEAAFGYGHPVTIDVMFNNCGEKPNRKICELVLSLEDLEQMVAQLRADLTKRS